MLQQDVPKLVVAGILFLVILIAFIVTLNILQRPMFTQRSSETVVVDFGPQTTDAKIRIVQPPVEEEVVQEVQDGG